MSQNLPDQKFAGHVDLDRFMGRWYVIASIPTMFEKGAVNATETYTWNEKKKRIDIDFKYRQDSPTGKEKSIPQKGFVHDEKSNAEWRVQPLWPFMFGYIIVDLAADYSDTVVGVPDRDHVWIMARKPNLEEARYNELVGKIKSLGYKTDELKRVPQQW